MKRKGFLAGLLGLAAAPVLAKVKAKPKADDGPRWKSYNRGGTFLGRYHHPLHRPGDYLPGDYDLWFYNTPCDRVEARWGKHPSDNVGCSIFNARCHFAADPLYIAYRRAEALLRPLSRSAIEATEQRRYPLGMCKTTRDGRTLIYCRVKDTADEGTLLR